jgi:molybdopterin converting factor small subunit
VKVTVTCLGHIKSSLGKEKVELERDGLTAGELIDALREIAKDDPRLGFSRFNTLVVVNGESAFTAAAEDRKLKDGDQVLLVPFSHGG